MGNAIGRVCSSRPPSPREGGRRSAGLRGAVRSVELAEAGWRTSNLHGAESSGASVEGNELAEAQPTDLRPDAVREAGLRKLLGAEGWNRYQTVLSKGMDNTVFWMSQFTKVLHAVRVCASQSVDPHAKSNADVAVSACNGLLKMLAKKSADAGGDALMNLRGAAVKDAYRELQAAWRSLGLQAVLDAHYEGVAEPYIRERAMKLYGAAPSGDLRSRLDKTAVHTADKNRKLLFDGVLMRSDRIEMIPGQIDLICANLKQWEQADEFLRRPL